MSDTQKLEPAPCPFCGGAADIEHLPSGRRSVGCIDSDGDCFGFQPLTSFATTREAIAAWNRRASPWRPIAEAVRDETRRLLWRDRGGHSLPVIGFWSSWNQWWTTGESDRTGDHVALWAPTHFMPLPPPPQEPSHD